MFAIALIIAAALQAQPADQEPQPSIDMLDCGRIENAEARLACYDAIRDALAARQAAGLPAPSLIASAPSRNEALASAGAQTSAEAQGDPGLFGLPAPRLPRASFLSPAGLFGRDGNEAAEDAETFDDGALRVVERFNDGDPEVVLMDIVGVRQIGFEQYAFTMSNGQVWEQTSSQSANIPETGESAEAHIRRTRLGQHILRIDGTGNSLRVRRVE